MANHEENSLAPFNITSDSQVLLDRERADRSSLESQLREKSREVGETQGRYDNHSAELNAK